MTSQACNMASRILGNGPNVYLSKKCADSELGCAFICALVWAASDEYEKAAA